MTDWCAAAKALGFSQAKEFSPEILEPQDHVRDMCQADRCRVYGKNWTCPPHCGSLEQCAEAMHRFSRGILLQTVGLLSKDIDSRGYRETEQRHLKTFAAFCAALREAHPEALCLGSGGCRVCRVCAWPEPCRFPEQATASMEAYGLFVTQVCRDAGLAYHYGARTIAYTACVLFD